MYVLHLTVLSPFDGRAVGDVITDQAEVKAAVASHRNSVVGVAVELPDAPPERPAAPEQHDPEPAPEPAPEQSEEH